MDFYDKHTLYIVCNNLTAKALETYLQPLITEASTIAGIPNSKFYINLVSNKDGKFLRHAYVYIEKSEVYYLLVGLNTDGSERAVYIDQPGWEPVTELNLESLDSWADLEEEESKQECPKIKQNLPPLITIPATIEVEGSSLPIKVVRAVCLALDSKFASNTLKTSNVPQWIKPVDIKNHFKNFVANKKKYPIVTITASRAAFVEFESVGRNAEFALLMGKKLELTNNKTRETHTLIFSQAFKTKYTK